MILKAGKTLELDITTLAFGGKGIAKVKTEKGDFTLFVPNTLPGQHVLAKIIKKKKQYAECKLLSVITPSEDEQPIPFQEIPGAPYAKLPIENQQQHKKESVFYLLEKTGKINDVQQYYDEYIASPNSWHYRNKMEYSFSNYVFDSNEKRAYGEEGFGLGLKKRGQWIIVENLNQDSGLFDEELENNLSQLRVFLRQTGLPAWDPMKSEGFFRFLVVKKSHAFNTLLFHLVTTSTDIEKFNETALVETLQKITNNRVAGVMHTIYDDLGDRTNLQGTNSKLIFGADHLNEKINGLTFEIGIQSFFQTNPSCAEKLYDKVKNYVVAGLKEEKGVILDLFCGTGTIAQILAREFTDAQVIGVDIVNEAIEDAVKNSKINNLKNASFHAEDAGKFLSNYPQYKNNIACTVIDPPRAGLSKKTLSKVIDLNSPTLVYVSCNPATLARDLEILDANNYALNKFSIVDQFPHTSHVEVVALFNRKAD